MASGCRCKISKKNHKYYCFKMVKGAPQACKGGKALNKKNRR